MATPTLATVEQYLNTSYEGPDREFVNGEILERSMPPLIHGLIQIRLGVIFDKARQFGSFYAASEVRHKLGDGVYRIPDVAVYSPDLPTEAVPSRPPFIVVEIISPDDHVSDLLEKLAEYQAWGVPHIWVIDPQVQRLAVYRNGLEFVPAFTVPGHPIEIRFSDLTQ